MAWKLFSKPRCPVLSWGSSARVTPGAVPFPSWKWVLGVAAGWEPLQAGQFTSDAQLLHLGQRKTCPALNPSSSGRERLLLVNGEPRGSSLGRSPCLCLSCATNTQVWPWLQPTFSCRSHLQLHYGMRNSFISGLESPRAKFQWQHHDGQINALIITLRRVFNQIR